MFWRDGRRYLPDRPVRRPILRAACVAPLEFGRLITGLGRLVKLHFSWHGGGPLSTPPVWSRADSARLGMASIVVATVCQRDIYSRGGRSSFRTNPRPWQAPQQRVVR